MAQPVILFTEQWADVPLSTRPTPTSSMAVSMSPKISF